MKYIPYCSVSKSWLLRLPTAPTPDADRAEMQKEINQLTSEVNRIGNNTEFNTKKILNGGVATSLVSVTATTPPDIDVATGALSGISGTAGAADTPGAPGTAATWNAGTVAALTDNSSRTFAFNGYNNG